jgi:hypothetical protein
MHNDLHLLGHKGNWANPGLGYGLAAFLLLPHQEVRHWYL